MTCLTDLLDSASEPLPLVRERSGFLRSVQGYRNHLLREHPNAEFTQLDELGLTAGGDAYRLVERYAAEELPVLAVGSLDQLRLLAFVRMMEHPTTPAPASAHQPAKASREAPALAAATAAEGGWHDVPEAEEVRVVPTRRRSAPSSSQATVSQHERCPPGKGTP